MFGKTEIIEPQKGKNMKIAISSTGPNLDDAVESRFAAFAQKFADNSRQTHFLRLLKNHIQKYGAITVEKLYEEPFTTIDSDGLDGVFAEESQIDELINIIKTFQPQTGAQV